MEKKANSNLFWVLASSVTYNYDLNYLHFNWTVYPAVRYIQGSVTSYFVPKVDRFNEVKFDLSNSLIAYSVKYNGSSATFAHTARIDLEITMPAIISFNILDSQEVYYDSVPPNIGFAAF